MVDAPERFLDVRGARVALGVLAACWAAHVVLSTPLWTPRLDAQCSAPSGLYIRALCVSEAGPESQTQLGAALASHVIQAIAVALVIVLAWRARQPHDPKRSSAQLVFALVLTAVGAAAVYIAWHRLAPETAGVVQLAVVAAMVLVGRAVVRPPYAFGLVVFVAVASAIVVGGPLGVVVGAMTDALDRSWPSGGWLAVLTGMLGTIGPGLALITAFVQPERGAVWDHLRRRGS